MCLQNLKKSQLKICFCFYSSGIEFTPISFKNYKHSSKSTAKIAQAIFILMSQSDGRFYSASHFTATVMKPGSFYSHISRAVSPQEN